LAISDGRPALSLAHLKEGNTMNQLDTIAATALQRHHGDVDKALPAR
jgi:hypothetical protein